MKIVIIGGGPAAVESAVSARKNAPEAVVDIYSAENTLPYRRPALSGLLAKDRKIDAKTFYIKSADFFAAEKIGFHPGYTAKSIQGKNIVFASGEKVPFDKLIFANGGNAVRPGIPGAENGFTLRNLSDMEMIVARLDAGVKNAVIIGGGVLGLEIADSLLTREINTVVLEAADQLFPGRLAASDAANLLARVNALKNLQVFCGKCVAKITDHSVTLADGTEFPADIVILATGSRPDTTLAQSAGVKCNRGVIVNEFMQSSNADIFACGDTAEADGKCFNLYMDAMASGKTAGANAAGVQTVFAAKPSPVRLMALGEKLVM